MPFHCTTGCRSSRLTLTVALTMSTGVSNGRSKRGSSKSPRMPGLRGDRGKRGASDGNAQATEQQHQQQVMQLRQNRNVIENREERKHKDFGDQQEKRIGDELGEKYRERVADGQAKRAERVVALFAQKTGLQHQRGGEKNGEPEEAGAEFARFFAGGADGEAEQDQDHQDENDGGEKLAGTKFRAKFLIEQHHGVGEEAHGGGQALPNVRMSRSDAPVFVSAMTLPASRRTARVASAEISDSPCRLITMVQPARLSSRSEVASQVMPEGSRPVARSSRSSTEGR